MTVTTYQDFLASRPRQIKQPYAAHAPLALENCVWVADRKVAAIRGERSLLQPARGAALHVRNGVRGLLCHVPDGNVAMVNGYES